MNKYTQYQHCFLDQAIDRQLLRQRAFNYRWAEQKEDVIPLTAADPDFSLAPPIQRALTSYLSQGSLAYGPAHGLPAFRTAVAKDLKRGKVPAQHNQVLATDGAASAMFLVAKTLLKPDDEAIIFDPVDFLFERSVRSVGAKTIRVPFSRKNGIDLNTLNQLARRPRVKLIALCAPHNPFGRLIRAEEITEVARLAEAYQLHILSDEVWGKLVYDEIQIHTAAHPSASQRTFTVSGFSKCFGLAGLRIGYVHAPTDDLFEKMVNASHSGDTAFGASTLSQIAAVAGLEEGQIWFQTFLAHLRQARSLICERLNDLSGLQCDLPEATYLASPQMIKEQWSEQVSSEQLCETILRHTKVAVVPGSPRFFGAGAEGLIRLSFATSLDIINEAMDRLETNWPKVLKELGR